ncbi:MAG TPA: adenylate/guanylate cyclase domain-containing protein, partial [Syntrophobacteraceae bacterium]|nr:adenylate/guanylate cyclase domain-containing protein [Syntrophobacteraceae bacterium]
PAEAATNAALADVLSRVGRPDEALEAAARALHLKSALTVDEHLDGIGRAYALAGRPEEAIAPLKQCLARYPNRLDIHLTLAAVYSELDHDAEARAEVAEILRLNPRFSLEVHRERVSIKTAATLEHHIAVLRKAGLK